MSTSYAFRDSDLAAGRLAIVAELFDPTSREFLAAAGRPGVDLALDLGCGPGHTTRLLANVLRPRRTLGLDISPRFLERARQGAPDGVEFAQQDVTERLPPADLAYCRLLLSHLPAPASVAAGWLGSLNPGGRLLIEEVEWIETDDPVFRRYLEIVRAMLRGRSQRLEVGPELAAAPPAGATVVDSRVVTLSPDPARVAEMFLANLRAWSDEAPPGLEAELAHGARGPIVWTLRQIAYERRPA